MKTDKKKKAKLCTKSVDIIIHFLYRNANFPSQMQQKKKKKKKSKHLSISSSLFRIHVPASPDLNPTARNLVSLPRQNTGQVVLVHKIVLIAELSLLVLHRSDILLLILRQDELRAPSAFTAAAAFPLAAGVAGHRFGDAVPVAAVVPLHVLLQVQLELPVGVRGAGHAGQRVFPAARAELPVHFLGGAEAGVAALDVRLEMADPLQGCRREEVQVHLKQDVLTLQSY